MTARVLTPFVPSWATVGGSQLRQLNQGKLPVAQINRQGLLSAPTGHPISTHSLALLLDRPGTLHGDKAFLTSRIPWLWQLPCPWTAILDLWRYGLVILTSDDHQIISMLAGTGSTDERLIVQIFSCPWSLASGGVQGAE
jgi:hypothetical protein